ncbi:phosphoenolpyruvate carboxykinase (ATP) [Aestuariivirga litoralis]|nr:phosphoenolpyruvate carboxykinase (ATP) [Aestuariivirga litoralis]MBG1233785.1 phosphoenolpyruvate carboxykinase (ATP) [Aestuariivirga litoralis]
MLARPEILIADDGRDSLIRAELGAFGLRWLGKVSWNEGNWRLVQRAVARGEAQLSCTGALVVETGAHTGRSPKDKFIVLEEATAQDVWWDNNQAMSRRHFDQLRADMMTHARMRDVFVQDLEACPGAEKQFPVRVVTETAWASAFMRHLLAPVEGQEGRFMPGLNIICLPSFKADPARHGTQSETVIAIDFNGMTVLIGGTAYAGEMKKAVFTVLNYLAPQEGVLPMHCSANTDENGKTALFFGLSGTGKTTLSADPARALIGDDEHGWGENGIFNIENGCYAKVIKLDEAQEPAIYKAALNFGTVLENVVLNEACGSVDFDDGSRTENTRAAYSLSQIAGATPGVMGQHPEVLVMLTADAFGVLPPVARLTPEQAVEQFLLGYTAKVAGTERGVKEPEATFSACFGAPFLPRPPKVYAHLLRQKIKAHGTRCYLINTGWTGGGYGVGNRIALPQTRAILKAVLSGEVDQAKMRIDTNFGFEVPVALNGVDSKLLNPCEAWADIVDYHEAADDLVQKFKRAKK